MSGIFHDYGDGRQFDLSRIQTPEFEGHVPEHLRDFRSSGMSHCCFSGCTPMGCEGGCCLNMGYHEAHCPLNPSRQFDEAEHDAYVGAGYRRHVRYDDD